MRKLIIRDHRGHVEMDLDTEQAIKELESLMNQGMMATATKNGAATQVVDPTDALIRDADEVQLMWPLRGGV